MPRLTRIYTRTGDDGSTGLVSGERVQKNDPRIEATGAVDELNSHLGLALASNPDPALAEALRTVQHELFALGAELSCRRLPARPYLTARHVRRLERQLDALNAQLPPLHNFILPGGAPAAAQLQVARSVCRRAERRVKTLADRERLGKYVLPYLNRLSDLLFQLARRENQLQLVGETVWHR